MDSKTRNANRFFLRPIALIIKANATLIVIDWYPLVGMSNAGIIVNQHTHNAFLMWQNPCVSPIEINVLRSVIARYQTSVNPIAGITARTREQLAILRLCPGRIA